MSNGLLRVGPYRLEYYFQSDVGQVRTNNEDSLIAVPDEGLFGVCDGLGGHAAGEVASALASNSVIETLKSNHSEPADALQHALSRANRIILDQQIRNPEQRGMGTTVSLLWVAPHGQTESWVAHIGDSRVYRYRQRQLTQMTHDHSPVFRLHQHGVLTKEQLRTHPQKNLLDRSLGITEEIDPDIFSIPLEPDDLVLICTDGLSDLLTDDEIEKILPPAKVKECGQQLIEAANQKGGLDNITLSLIKVLADE